MRTSKSDAARRLLAAVILAWCCPCCTGIEGRAPGGADRQADACGASRSNVPEFNTSEAEVRDKIRGALLGQMIGVSWGFPTEFYARYIWRQFPDIHQVDGFPENIYAAYEGRPIPLDKLPVWQPDMINGAYTQDDLYVEVPFMEALLEHGVNAGWDVLGQAFAESEFPLYHANLSARNNLRAGIAPPMSGHYSNGGESDDIDWQIEADFVGLMNPGQLHSAADIAFRTGHIMNYGDGVYGGVFVATMVARAFTAESVREIVDAGCQALPAGSQYRIVLDQVLERFDRGVAYGQNLAFLNAMWGGVDRCAEWGGPDDPLNIDAKLNGAYILLGLLYGGGDFGESMRLAMAAGQDSDCNPSNVGSILGAFYGEQAIAASGPDWLSGLDDTLIFQTTPHTLDDLVDRTVELARRVVEFKGGSAPQGGTWSVPMHPLQVVPIFEQWPQEPNDAPHLTATVSLLEGRTVRVQADASDDDGIREYQWFFGDLSFASGAQHDHTFRAAGSYQITAYVADTVGNTTCKVLSITIP